MIETSRIYLKLLWNHIKLDYYLHRMKAATKTANTMADRVRAMYPDLFKEDE